MNCKPDFKYEIINTDDITKLNINELINTSKNIRFNSNLIKMKEFIESSAWKDNLEKTIEGHNIAYKFISELFKGYRVLFTDKNNVLNDSGNLYNDLTQNDKNFINNIDSYHFDSKIYRYGNLYSMYIGSTVTIETTGFNYNFDITFTGKENTIQINEDFTGSLETNINGYILRGTFMGISSSGDVYNTYNYNHNVFNGTFSGMMTSGTTSTSTSLYSLYSGIFSGSIYDNNGNLIATGELSGTCIGEKIQVYYSPF